MTDLDIWEVSKETMRWIIYPLMGLFGYLYKRQNGDIDILKQDISQLKINQAVSMSQIDDIRNDIKELTIAVKELTKAINRIDK